MEVGTSWAEVISTIGSIVAIFLVIWQVKRSADLMRKETQLRKDNSLYVNAKFARPILEVKFNRKAVASNQDTVAVLADEKQRRHAHAAYVNGEHLPMLTIANYSDNRIAELYVTVHYERAGVEDYCSGVQHAVARPGQLQFVPAVFLDELDQPLAALASQIQAITIEGITVKNEKFRLSVILPIHHGELYLGQLHREQWEFDFLSNPVDKHGQRTRSNHDLTPQEVRAIQDDVSLTAPLSALPVRH
ncbi:hypothetical protein IV38_GL000171 [Lactobacillus selangorensis]|uniref:Uncharacterized protein n=2 Tax=Lactobacillus selangorensis TaxID=81857 RepID=A0A0R2G3Q0_9LACO|nr:hypothetical protein IV38_GL000171 [Lactobacillus selangorensis]KRN34182.1 hypothetical protein IV40_GL000498 [Lactobacillus selangorensis]